MSDEYDEQAERMLPCTCNNRDGREGHFSSCGGYWREEVAAGFREAGKREADLQAEIEVGLQLAGSFFEALKPLNLQAINLQNPGQHVTDLITERDDLRREVERVTHDAVYHRVTVENQREEIAALKALETSIAPCGHLSKYCYTENEGKNIYCYSCQVAALKAKMAPFTNRGQTHYEGCWKDRGHHACALERLAEAEKRNLPEFVASENAKYEKARIEMEKKP